MDGRKKKDTRREAILDAALEEFSSKGYAVARMEDIARRAKVAKGTLYIHFKDKEGLFNGLITSVLSEAHAHTPEVLEDASLSLRDKLLRIYQPVMEGGRDSKIARVIRLVCAEGLHSPALVVPYYRTMLEPILELHRENLRRPPHPGEPAPHPSLSAFPQLLAFPLFHGIIWQGLYGAASDLDAASMYRAYLDMILPETA